MGKNKNVTSEEVQYIKVNCMVKSIAEMAMELHRNYWTVHRVLQKLGVRKSHVFTADDDFIIRKMYGKYNVRTIAAKLGVDEVSIYNRLKKLRLRKKAEMSE